ncbi:MAG: ATP-binding protein [Nitrospirota bacterium]
MDDSKNIKATSLHLILPAAFIIVVLSVRHYAPDRFFPIMLVLIGGMAASGYGLYRALQKKRADRFETRQEYYRGILESGHESILVVDRQFRVHDLNENFLKATGRRREDVVGRPCYAVSHGRTSPCQGSGDHPCPVLHAFETGRSWSGVHTHYRENGEPFEVEVSASPLRDGKGRTLLVVETMRDITELNHLKALFLQAQKMEAVGRLAGGMAHDFNNLMNVVIGYSEMVLHRLPPDDPNRPALESVLDAGERAANVTSQLLAFSRRQIIEPKIVDLNGVLTNMEGILQRVIGEDIELACMYNAELWRVKADPGLIEQAVMNLAVNARDAMPDGGKLVMETANVELDEGYVRTHAGAAAGPFVMLAVSDTGTGMPKEVKARIFEPFFTTKEVGKGTGLGLSTAYGIVKQHNGYIMAYSEPGHGTSFKIYLPRAEGEPEHADKRTPETVPRGDETVLLVEDDEGLRTMATVMLEELGYRVLPCASGEEALAQLSRRNGTVDVLFTDIVMPGMSGTVLAERAAGLHRGLKVLFTSGYPDNAISQRGVLAPGTHFIQKPFTSAALGQRMREIIDQ